MKEMVVKDNALINASYNLDLVEQRLILLAIVEARKNNKPITSDDILAIHASSYIKQFDVERHTAYESLKNAVNTLFARQFSYTQNYKNTGKREVVRSRWVSRISYVDDLAIININFASDVIPLITHLEKQFTSYELEQVSSLSSTYAVRLYELLIQWRSTCETPVFDLAEFRNRLGVEANEYKTMSNFKSRVLDPAVNQINEHTDITASYEQHKAGRVITGFSFSFKLQKPAKAIKKEPTERPKNNNEDTEKREALSQFIGYQQRAKLLNEPIENLLTKKELAQFRKFEFM
jgi:plasmid replication initiation protein